MECKELPTALFLLVAAHYIFNLPYHPKVADALLFLQEYVMGEEETRVKKHAHYLYGSSCISRFVPSTE